MKGSTNGRESCVPQAQELLHPTSLGRFKSAVIFQKIRDTGRPEMSEANSALAGLCQIARKKFGQIIRKVTHRKTAWRGGGMMPSVPLSSLFLEHRSLGENGWSQERLPAGAFAYDPSIAFRAASKLRQINPLNSALRRTLVTLRK